MYLFNEEGDRVGYISVHVKCLILNDTEKNILYEFGEYKKLIRDVDINIKVDTSNILPYIIANCKAVADLDLKDRREKSKKKNLDNQFNLF